MKTKPKDKRLPSLEEMEADTFKYGYPGAHGGVHLKTCNGKLKSRGRGITSGVRCQCNARWFCY